MAFITGMTGSTDGGPSVKQDCSSLSPTHVLRGPRQRGHVSLCDPKLHYLSVDVQRERSRSGHRTRSRSKKEMRRELQSISKAIHIPSGRGLSSQLSITWVGRAMSSTTPQPSTGSQCISASPSFSSLSSSEG